MEEKMVISKQYLNSAFYKNSITFTFYFDYVVIEEEASVKITYDNINCILFDKGLYIECKDYYDVCYCYGGYTKSSNKFHRIWITQVESNVEEAKKTFANVISKIKEKRGFYKMSKRGNFVPKQNNNSDNKDYVKQFNIHFPFDCENFAYTLRKTCVQDKMFTKNCDPNSINYYMFCLSINYKRFIVVKMTWKELESYENKTPQELVSLNTISDEVKILLFGKRLLKDQFVTVLKRVSYDRIAQIVHKFDEIEHIRFVDNKWVFDCKIPGHVSPLKMAIQNELFGPMYALGSAIEDMQGFDMSSIEDFSCYEISFKYQKIKNLYIDKRLFKIDDHFKQLQDIVEGNNLDNNGDAL